MSKPTERAMRATWAVVAVALLALGTFICLDLYTELEATEAHERQRLVHQSNIAERALAAQIQSAGDALDAALEGLPALLAQPAGLASVQQRLSLLIKGMTGVSRLVLVNAKGEPIANSGGIIATLDLDDPGFLRTMRSDPRPKMLYVTAPFTSPCGTYTIGLARVVTDNLGRFEGYVMAIANLEYFNALLGSLLYAPDMRANLIHGDGKIIFRVPDRERVTGRDLSQSDGAFLAQHLRSGQPSNIYEGVVAATHDRRLVAFRTLQPRPLDMSTPLVIAIGRSTAAIDAVWTKQAEQRLGLYGLVVLITLWGMLAYQRRQRAYFRLVDDKEALRRQLNEEAERLTHYQVVGQTIAAIAHELNQPLNAVSVYSEAAVRLLHAEPPQPDKLQRALENSALQAQRAGEVFDELLIFLRRGESEKRAVDLNDLIDQAVQNGDADGTRTANISLNLDPALAKVVANRLQLEKVVANLLRNGIEGMRDAGIRSSACTIKVQTRAQNGMAEVAVTDCGPGIDDETLARVFDPFFTTKRQGLGMGLAISKAIIQEHGGEMWATSSPGKGSTFHFTVPFAA